MLRLEGRINELVGCWNGWHVGPKNNWNRPRLDWQRWIRATRPRIPSMAGIPGIVVSVKETSLEGVGLGWSFFLFGNIFQIIFFIIQIKMDFVVIEVVSSTASI